MNVQRIAQYLAEMLQAATDATEILGSMTRPEFMADKKAQLAVTMCLLRIGEQAGRVLGAAPDFAKSHPGIPWIAIRGMRNQIAHNYENIDLDIVWQTAQAYLQELTVELRDMPDRLE